MHSRKDFKLSIVMPSFNQGRYLEEAIASVLEQGYPKLEFIIIDGGSRDDSVEIIKKYQRHLTYWVSESDGGQSQAINKALEHVTGEVIGWLNSDDAYAPQTFRKVVRAFRERSDAVLVHGDRIMIDSDSLVAGWTAYDDFEPEVNGYTLFSETAFWRADAARGMRFDENLQFAMDVDFFCRLYRRGKFVKLPEFLGYFRCHDTSKSATLFDVAQREGRQQWEKIFGPDSKGWSIAPQGSRWVQMLRLLQHPMLIGGPYAYRRIVKRRRGMLASA